MAHNCIQLGVNVDHIATLREARGTTYPDPMQAADIARRAGADGITVHLREDRRHIQEHDVFSIKGNVALPLNLEMAATSEMLKFAKLVQPAEICLVPEKRQELTTEGGLDVVAQQHDLTGYISELAETGAKVSLFIDAQAEQIEAAKEVGADIVELPFVQFNKLCAHFFCRLYLLSLIINKQRDLIPRLRQFGDIAD